MILTAVSFVVLIHVIGKYLKKFIKHDVVHIVDLFIQK